MSGEPPASIRALVAALGVVDRIAHACRVVVEELVLAGVPAARRDDVTAWCYGRRDPRSIDLAVDRGLAPWEVEAFEAFPERSRLLVGGAGLGREVRALVERGHEVVAFEPSRTLVEAAGPALSNAAMLVQGSYRDLVEGTAGRVGPLRSLAGGRRFGGVLLGWGSFTHVLEDDERIALLRACRALTDEGPIVVSFWLDWPEERGRLRLALRRSLRAMGGHSADRLRFLPHAGFVRGTSLEDLKRLVDASELRIAHFSPTPYPHAVLAAGRAVGT